MYTYSMYTVYVRSPTLYNKNSKQSMVVYTGTGGRSVPAKGFLFRKTIQALEFGLLHWLEVTALL
jgi:hypothetical protein